MRLRNARPEGYQDPDLVRPQLRTAPGRRHSNGGGWVDDRANVEATVYVGPRAIVAGSSTITGSVRIEGYSYVQDAQLSGHVLVTDNAFVLGGKAVDSVVIMDQCLAVNNDLSGGARLAGCSQVLNYTLGGNVRIDGDLVVYNEEGECSSGEYHVLTQYYRNDLLPCDERDSTHPQNVSVNRPLVFETVSVADAPANLTGIYPNPVRDEYCSVMLTEAEQTGFGHTTIMDMTGAQRRVVPLAGSSGSVIRIDVGQLPTGTYALCTYDRSGALLVRRPLIRLR
jgi:hypothetical protein